MAVGHGGYVGAIETGDGLTTVAAALDPDHLRTSGGAASAVRAVLDESGLAVGQALDDADWSGTLPLTRRLVRPAAARVLVLGDAAGYVEPFTGEGIAWAYTGAEALAPIARQAVATPAWDPRCEQAWTDTYARRIGREPRWCRAVARLLRSDPLLGPAMALLRWQPGIARPLLAHLSAAPALRHR
jgi:flavin-dependent dehydrogenase